MNTVKTLLLREWLQHRTGWLLLAFVPIALMLLLLPFGQVQISGTQPANVVALAALGGFTLFVAALAWIALGLQTPGLARRDRQDRSIEFWRSLPVSDAQAVAATLGAHLVLMPLAVMAIGMLGGVATAAIVVVRVYGWAGLQALDAHYIASMLLAGLPRLALGSLLASFWAAALLMPLMAASAWLKGWGVAAMITVVGVGGLVLDKGYGQTAVLDAVTTLSHHFVDALVPLPQGFEGRAPADAVPAWFWQDALQQLQALASPSALLALALVAGSFGLLVWRRRRG